MAPGASASISICVDAEKVRLPPGLPPWVSFAAADEVLALALALPPTVDTDAHPGVSEP